MAVIYETAAVLSGACPLRQLHSRVKPVPSLLSAVALGLVVSGSASAAGTGRSYDLVSPTDKNGVDVQSDLKVSTDGNSVAWVSLGAYAGTPGANAEVPYVATRGSDGAWSVRSFFPRMNDSYRPGFLAYLGGYAFSADLRAMTFVTNGSFDPDDLDLTVTPFGTFAQLDAYRTTGDGNATWVSHKTDGPNPNELIDVKLSGVSRDGSTILFSTTEAISSEVTAGSGIQHLYRWKNGVVDLVGVDENGDLLPGGTQLGTGESTALPSTGNGGDLIDDEAVSTDGQRFVYVGNPGGPTQLYLHEADGSVTRISSSQRTGSVGDPSPDPATFVASIDDLGIVYIRSASQLTDDAPVGGGDYAYDTETRRLTFSNVDDRTSTNFGGGFIRASQDGRYVYFGSTQDLAPGATAGTVNLYRKSPSGLEFISPLSAGDPGLYAGQAGAQVSSFTTSGMDASGDKFVYQSTASATARDTRGRAQVYLYDANAPMGARVTCISCDPRSNETTGDATLGSNSDYRRATPRVISADGTRVVFATQESLVDADTNTDPSVPANGQDVYEWVDGAARLISTGTSGARASIVDITADGRDVYFRTRSSLAPEDTDNGLLDIYDARLGEPRTTSNSNAGCNGDDCQAPPTVNPSPGTPGSETATSSGNVVPEDETSYEVGAISSAALKRAASTGKLTLSVKVVGEGRVSASAFARIKGLDVRIASASKSAKRSSTVKLTLNLSRAARNQLKKSGKLKVRLTVSFSGVPGSTSKSVTLRAKKQTRKPRNTRKGR